MQGGKVKEDANEIGAVLEAIVVAERTELAELQLALAGGGFGEVVLV
jgi:hypothetical protein